jgi:predicted nucleotidyltransferase
MSTSKPQRPSGSEAGAVLFGQTRRRVLGWLYGHADEAFYLRQIVRLTGAAQGAVQRELNALSGAGLLVRTVQGRQVYFRANRESPVFPELQSLLVKTTGVVDVLRNSLLPFGERVVAALVFGSVARGELTSLSDIDLIVIGDAPFEAIVDALQGAQTRIGRDVNPSVAF